MSTPAKEEKVREFTQKLSEAKGVFFTDFTGLDVEAMYGLRTKFRDANIEYKVIKNTLLKLSLKEAGITEDALKYLQGPTGIAMGYDDPIAPARVLKEYLKKSDKPVIKACLIDGQLFDGSEFEVVAKMKSKDELIGDVLGLLMSPASALTGALQSVGSELVSIIEEIAKRQETSE